MEENTSFKLTKKWILLFSFLVLFLLALVFLLGARLGGGWMSAEKEENSVEKKSDSQHVSEKVLNEEKNANSEKTEPAKESQSEEENTYKPDNQLDEGAPKYEVSSEGDSIPVDSPKIGSIPATGLGEEQQGMDAGPMYHSKNPQTMIRFKSSDHSRFAIQIGEYQDESRATKTINDLNKKGYDAYLVIQNPKSYIKNYSVRVGAFTDHQSAESLAASLSNALQLELQVIRIN